MNLPTKITFSRIIATVLMLLTLFVFWCINKIDSTFVISNVGDTSLNWLYLGMFVFFALASYTDHLDGKLARKNNQITNLGKFLDPVADKLLINSMVIFLCISHNFVQGQMTFSFWCAIILIVRDIVVDALRFIAAQKGIVVAANVFGKLKTVLEMIAIMFVLLNGYPFSFFMDGTIIANIFVYLCTFASLLSGIIYVIQNKKVFKE